ncbi:PREDICTED: uncharacterized protein K02A2.6-like, partial [Paramuricea clavata]
MKGWSTPQDEAIKPFYQRKDELTVHCGVVMLGHRAFIPAKLTIDRLRTIFARYGVPAQVVTDNGPQFTSAEFQLFLKTNGIKHITTAPFHPATNGQAERFVQSFKHAMKCEKQSASQLKTNMAKFLLAYRNTPHSTTGESPSVLFLGRPLRTRLDLVKPDLQRKVMNRQIDQAGRKGHSPTRQLSIGQTVMARNYSGKDKWLPGIVRAQTGSLSYEIKLRASSVKVNDQSDDTAEPHPELGETGQNIATAEEIVAEPDIELATNPPVVQQQEAGRATTGSEQRYPTRSHQPPERSINRKELFINDYVSENDIDILAMTETWLRYHFYHVTRKNARGGGVVLIDKYENTLKETLQQHAPQKRRIITLRPLSPCNAHNQKVLFSTVDKLLHRKFL